MNTLEIKLLTTQYKDEANNLIIERYQWRGYKPSIISDNSGYTLIALINNKVIGTITINIDSANKLAIDNTFTIVNEIRQNSNKICEFTKLALDPILGTKKILISLFHCAVIIAYYIHNCDILLMEINPRHVKYYKRQFGFEQVSDEQINNSVEAPSTLLSISFSYVIDQISKFAGLEINNNLYSFFFIKKEEHQKIEYFKQFLKLDKCDL